MTLSSYESVVVYHVSLLAHNHCLTDHCLFVLYQHLSLWSCCSLSVVHMSFTVLNACTTTLCHVRGLVVITSVVVCIGSTCRCGLLCGLLLLSFVSFFCLVLCCFSISRFYPCVLHFDLTQFWTCELHLCLITT